jgi:hypothetical protein
MPYTRTNIKRDIEDIGSVFDGPPDLEFHAATEPLELEQSALPGMWRGFEAGPEGLELLVIGAPNLGDDPRGDVDGLRDWWAD